MSAPEIARATEKLVPLAKAARIAGMPLNTFRRRMYRMNYLADGKLLIPRGDGQDRRHFDVDVHTLNWLIRSAPIEQEHDAEGLRWAVEDLRKELAAEKRKRIAFEATVRRWIFGGRKATQGHARPQPDLL